MLASMVMMTITMIFDYISTINKETYLKYI